MKLSSFRGVNVNGYLNFDFGILDDLTFLTGINGTGKTSALNSIASLLMPRLDYLASHEFDEISITIEESGEKVVLTAVQSEGQTSLTCSKFTNQEIVFEPFSLQSEYPTYKMAELEDQYYKDLQESYLRSDIIQFIYNLPTPMFLGLDRRSRSIDGEKYSVRRRYVRGKLSKRNVFGSSLKDSLSEALSFAENELMDCFRKKSILDRKFRDNLILELLNFPLIEFELFNRKDEKLVEANLKKAKGNVYRIPDLLKVGGVDISARLNKLFEFVEENLAIAQEPDIESHQDEPWDTPSFKARYKLAQNRPSIDKINALSGMVSEYTRNLDDTFKRVNEFLKVINSFIQDSDKTIDFDERGYISFRIGAESVVRELRSLSSGEIQLLVIFAHLYFNPETARANVFIIDEPELSLHVQWQAKFVDAVLAASKNTQFLMATHSPTVIMGRIEHCKEILTQK